MDIWINYKSTGNQDLRNQIIVKYFPTVKQVAKQMAYGLPPFINEEDLESYGVFGLIDAIEKFDPDKGFKFETYAVTRIKGAILDELRALDWAPRSVRAKSNAIERVITTYEHGLPMSEREAAKFLGMSDTEFRKHKADEVSSQIGSFDIDMNMDLNGGDESLAFSDFVADGKADNSTLVEYEHIKNKIVLAINLLPERERILVYLYYFEQLTLADIGKMMQVTESRVCQIHTAICNTLKNVLQF